MQLFDWIYIGEVGAHDGDWEHVTLRLSPDARQVLGIYYSAHRYSCTGNHTTGKAQSLISHAYIRHKVLYNCLFLLKLGWVAMSCAAIINMLHTTQHRHRLQ